jgi:hypothetical protein
MIPNSKTVQEEQAMTEDLTEAYSCGNGVLSLAIDAGITSSLIAGNRVGIWPRYSYNTRASQVRNGLNLPPETNNHPAWITHL